MTKVRKFTLLVSALMLLFMLAILACTVSKTSTADTVRGDDVTEITANEGEKLSLVNPDGESTKYVILYSAADDLQADSVLAGDLSGLLYAKGVYFRFLPDTAQSTETEFEILLGTTNRQESKDFYNEILASAKAGDDLAWGYATVGSKVLFTANSTDSFAIGRAEFLEFLAECDYSPDSGVKRIITMTRQEYEEKLEAEEEERRAQYIKELQAMLGKFEDSQFNTDKFAGQGEFYKPLINDEGLYLTGSRTYGTAKYESPWYYPAENQHPRYLITSAQLDEIKKILAMGEDPNSDYATLAKTFWKFANTDMESIHYGVFQNQYKNTGANSWLEPTGEPYRYDGETLGIIDAKAMAYLITGDVRYAYEAIIAIKNAMLSLHYTTDLHQDVYHGPSHVMVTLAAVYDWCYPVLSETDKWHLIWGTAQILGPQMESGYRYPPTGHNGVNGHGTGPQLLRDWMTMATVFYDEAPDWWEFIAGRYFEEYLPVSNAQFTNGWVSQGTACYAPIKIHVAAWAAYLIYVACGEQVLTPDARQTMYFFMSHTTPKDYDAKNPDNQAWREYYFQTGDGPRSETGTLVGFAESFVVAALFNDPVIYAYAKHITNNHSRFDTDTIFTMTPAFQLCFTSMVDYNGEGYRDGVDTIQYFADPAGQMTVREAWDDPDSVAVMMRLMNLTMANHEGKDHGTFQIYYKGLLAATSGSYKKYGAATHLYYLQATIGHNGLLVFNPAHASENPNNTASYYYSGSQEYKNFSSKYASWIENSRMVTTIGADYGYNADGTPKYGYLAGDMTEAYPAKTAEYIARHMLTVFTGDEDFPAIVVTFDQINAFGENFSKSWLLHTIKEPEIDIDNLTATVVNGEGKLLVQSLFGADAIMKVGGEGKAYWINGYFKDYNDRGSWDVKTQSFTDENDKGSWVEGKNVLDEFTPDDNAKNIWGRIELRSVGSKATDFLTVMAVTDASNEKSFVTTPFESETVYGFSALKKTVAFAKSYDLEYEEFTFDTDGVGLHEYYVAGLASGTWRVYVDGVAVATTFSKEEGAIINFTAPTGKVTIKPGNDVVGANGGKIQYVTGGATMPENTPYSYNNENVTPLPLEGIVRGEDTFLGWYLTETFEDGTEITEIPMGTTGTVKVYARWISTFLTEDYSSTKINIKESSQTTNGINYNGSTKTGSSFITKADIATGRKYLEWIEGEKDPIINQTSTNKNFSTLGSPDKCVTFDIAISANPGSTPMKTEFRILAKQTVGGVSINAVGTDIFRTKTDGKVYAMDKGTEKYLTTLSADSITHLRIVMDFKNGQIRYYDENNYYFDTTTFTAPSSTEAANTEEYLRCLTQYLWYWYGASEAGYSDAALRIYEIAVREGDRVSMDAPADAIIYSTAGGKIVGNAPNGYNTKTGTALPTEVSRDCFEFDGWYLDPDFSGEPVTEIGKGGSGPITVYAKWKVSPNTINYNLNGGELSGDYDRLYDAENGTDITNIVPVRTGRVFVGWYTSPTFEEETRVGVIGKGATEPVDVYAKWTYPDGSIIYELNGASKPAGLPETFVTGTVTPIPGDITKDFATFLGWYTTPDFKEGTLLTEIPADQTGFVTLYAKWAVKVSENWSSTDVDISNGSSVGKNGISYSGKGDSVYTTVDENGNRYLLWKPGTSDPTLIISNAKIAPRYMAESAISYTLTIGKNGDAVIPNFEYRLIGKKNVSGGAAQSDIYFGKLIDGTFYLGNNAEQPLYNLYEEERVTVRIVIDFEDTTDDGTVNGTITAYDENGAAIGSLTFAPTSASGATTMAEYKQCFDNYLFYSRKTGSGGTLDDAIRYYELTVEEGNKHKKTSNAINYVTSGGMLPDGAPSEYDPVNGTDVSGVIPTRHGYIFLGWYTTVGCLDGTRVENIGKGESYSIVLYAKWDIDPTSVYYEPNGGTLIGKSVDNYNPETGTDISSVTAEKHGYDFAGWYLDKDLTVPADGYIGKGGTATITLYAKWTVRKDTIYYETNGGVIEGDFDEFYDAENGTALPENVSRENYIFAGWYLDAEFTVPAGEKIGVGADAPITVYAKWTVPDGRLVFVANGGTLPENMPDSYDSATGLLLPTNVTRDGYVFGGWYTDPEFKSDRMDYVKYGSTCGYVFYAKWVKPLIDKNFDNDTANLEPGKTTNINGVSANSTNCSDGSLKTAEDEKGGKYIKVEIGKGSIFIVASEKNGYSINKFDTPELALEFDYGRIGSEPLLTSTLRLETSGSRYGKYDFLKIDGATGEARFCNESGKLSDKVIATVGSEAVTFRIVIDFYNETVTAYGESGEILDRVKLGAVPKISTNAKYAAENLVQPNTWLEWQSKAYGYYFYNTFSLPSGVARGVALYDNLKVYDGNPYFTFINTLPVKNGLIFVTNGGELTDAPKVHDAVNGTDLSTVVPTKYGYVLEGWYTTETLDEGTRVENLPAGDIDPTTLYAKWVIDPTTLYVELDGGTLNKQLPEFYDAENGTSLEAYQPTKQGYAFAGWYDNPKFSGEPLTSVGAGKTAPITLYAKWDIGNNVIYYELNGGALPESAQGGMIPKRA